MRAPYTRLQVKHLSVLQKKTTIFFENVFTDKFSDYVIICLVADDYFAGKYNSNKFNFQDFGVNCLEPERHGMPLLCYGFTPNFVGGRFIKNYC